MQPSTGRRWVALLLLLGFFLGCAVPSVASPPLTAEAVKNVLDSWNPNYCKVAEFYGIYAPGERANARMAYVLIGNPSDKNQKPTRYEARFQLLTIPEGGERWFLVSLVTHSSGLTRRQGWDNLMIEVPAAPAASSR